MAFSDNSNKREEEEEEEEQQQERPIAAIGKKLTENDQETDEDGGQSAHAQPDDLALLVELAVLAQEAVRTVAQVERLAVDAHAAVEARVRQTFVSVDTALAVQSHHL